MNYAEINLGWLFHMHRFNIDTGQILHCIIIACQFY